MQQAIVQTEIELKCLHCKQTFKPRLGSSIDYCCLGCQTVAETLKRLGLEKYYDLQPLEFDNKNHSIPKGRTYAWLDDNKILKQYEGIRDDNLCEVVLPIDGIHCAGCLWVIEELPKIVKGIQSSSVSVSSAEANLVFDPKIISAREIAVLLDTLGYPIRIVHTEENTVELQSKAYLWRLGIAAFAALNTMMLGVSLFQALFTGIEKEYAELFRWISLLLTIPAVTYCAAPFYKNFVFALRLKRFHIDQPIVLAIVAGFILSVWNTLQGNLFVYYDSISALIFFLLLGRFIQARALEQARKESKLTGEVLPEVATVFIDREWKEQLTSYLNKDDKVRLNASQIVPVDGVVSSGKAEVDKSILTGESNPVKISINDLVYAGTKLLNGDIEITATTDQKNSRIGKILSKLQRLDFSQNQFSRFAEVVSGYFVVFTLLIALCGFLLWLPQGIATASAVFLTVLIVSCPCALGIAIPAALGVSIGRSARQGIYIFDPLVFDKFLKIKNYFFDKTGTLTTTLPELLKIENLSNHDFSSIEKIIGALVKATPNHPIARSVANYCQESDLSAENVKIVPGMGIEGDVDGVKYFFGSKKWLTDKQIAIDSGIDIFLNSGMTVSLLASTTQALAILVFKGEIRPEVKPYLRNLNAIKWILSGDSESAVNHCARALEISTTYAKASLSPEDKAEFIKTFAEPTLMIGDGINDALALHSATIGVGVKGGLEVTLPVADIYLSSGKVEDLKRLEGCVKNTNYCILIILLSSVVYNTFGIVLTLYGKMNPLIAAIIMPLNSLGVLALALWWPRYRVGKV